MLRLQSSGIIALYKLRHMPSTDECNTDVPPETKTRSLNLTDLAPAFLILGIGLSLSTLEFLIETLIKYLKILISNSNISKVKQPDSAEIKK